MTNRILLCGEEFLEKILEGERDFKGIELRLNTNLRLLDNFKHVNQYLLERVEELKKDPIDISGSAFGYTKAVGIVIPYLHAHQAKIKKCNFSNAYLIGADFTDSILIGTNFRYANLSNACFLNAHIGKAKFYYANLENVDLRYLIQPNNPHQSSPKLLGKAEFGNTLVTPEVWEKMKEFTSRKGLLRLIISSH